VIAFACRAGRGGESFGDAGPVRVPAETSAADDRFVTPSEASRERDSDALLISIAPHARPQAPPARPTHAGFETPTATCRFQTGERRHPYKLTGWATGRRGVGQSLRPQRCCVWRECLWRSLRRRGALIASTWSRRRWPVLVLDCLMDLRVMCCHDALVLRVLMRLVVCVTLSAVLLPVALAQAVPLSPGNPGASNPQVSLNPAGRYVITWSAARVPGSFIVATGTLPALPREAFSVGEANTVAPTAAVSNGGAFALAWYQRVGYVKSSVQALMGSIGTSGGALQTLEGAAFVTSDSQPAIAFGSADRPLIGWTQDGAGTDHASVLLSTGRIGGGFAPAQPVFSEPSRASLAGTQIAVDGAGQPTVVWDRGGVICNGHLTAHAARSCRPTSERVYAANGDEAGRLGQVQHFGAGCAEPHLVEAPSGAAAIVMVCNRRGDIAIEVAQRSAGGSFRRPRVIPGRLADDFEPAVTLAPSGRLTIGYLHRRSLNKPHEGDESTRVEVASGQLGTRTMRVHGVSPYLNAGRPVEVLTGPGGQPYLATAQNRSGRLAVSLIRGDLTLGASVYPAPRGARDLTAQLASSGQGLAVWDDRHTGIEAATFTVGTP